MEDEDRHELEDVNLQLVSVEKEATPESHGDGTSTAEPSPVPPAGFSPGDEMTEVSIWCQGPLSAHVLVLLMGQRRMSGTTVARTAVQQYRWIVFSTELRRSDG